jgi:HEPN domain-containing protein
MRRMTEEWLSSARDDLDTIRAIENNPRLTNVAAFHAQQCVEKCYKAILEEHEIDIPNIHNLVTL